MFSSHLRFSSHSIGNSLSSFIRDRIERRIKRRDSLIPNAKLRNIGKQRILIKTHFKGANRNVYTVIKQGEGHLCKSKYEMHKTLRDNCLLSRINFYLFDLLSTT